MAEAEVRGRAGRRALDWRAWAAYTDWRERFFDRETGRPGPHLHRHRTARGRRPPGRAARRPRPRRPLRGCALRRRGFAARPPSRGLSAAALLHMREGFPVPYFQVGEHRRPHGRGRRTCCVTGSLDRYRLPGLVLLDLRLERGFSLGRGRFTAALDVFNATNASTAPPGRRATWSCPAFDRAARDRPPAAACGWASTGASDRRTRRARGLAVQSPPMATGRSGSLLHSLHEPA